MSPSHMRDLKEFKLQMKVEWWQLGLGGGQRRNKVKCLEWPKLSVL